MTDNLAASRRTRRTASFASIVALTVFCIGCGPSTDVTDHPGKAIYQRYCYACHQAGIADAPRLGDKDAWAPRLTKSRADLVESVVRGMSPGMPPRAGCGTCSDEDLAQAVDFMVRRVE